MHTKALPPVMTKAVFSQILTYFSKWKFQRVSSDHPAFAAETFYFSSAGRTVWHYLSEETQSNFLQKLNSQISNTSTDNIAQNVLTQAVTQLALHHETNPASYLSQVPTVSHFIGPGQNIITILFDLLLYRAEHGANTSHHLFVAQVLVSSLGLDLRSTMEVMAQILCLAHILGVSQYLPPFDINQSFVVELKEQLNRDGLLLRNGSNENHALSSADEASNDEIHLNGIGEGIPAPVNPGTLATHHTLANAHTEWKHSNTHDCTTTANAAGSDEPIDQTTAPLTASRQATPDIRQQASSMSTPPITTTTSDSIPNSSAPQHPIKGTGPVRNLFDGKRAEAVAKYRYTSRTSLGCTMDDNAISSMEKDQQLHIDSIIDAIRAGPVNPSPDEVEGVDALETSIKKRSEGTVEEATEALAYMIFETLLDTHREGHALTHKEIKSIEEGSTKALRQSDPLLSIDARLEAIIKTLGQNKRVVLDCYGFEAKIRNLVYGPNLVVCVKKAAAKSNLASGKGTKALGKQKETVEA